MACCPSSQVFDTRQVYSHDHANYIKQMHDWHMKMHHYQDKLRAYHLEQAKHYNKMMGERVKVAEISTDDIVA